MPDLKRYQRLIKIKKHYLVGAMHFPMKDLLFASHILAVACIVQDCIVQTIWCIYDDTLGP